MASEDFVQRADDVMFDGLARFVLIASRLVRSRWRRVRKQDGKRNKRVTQS
jgi:hypothetical protein